MNSKQKDVSEFHKLANVVPDPTTPIKLDKKTAFLRYNLIKEELMELAEALGIVLNEKLEPIDFDESQYDEVGVLDAAGDIDYVTNGLYCSIGVDSEPFWNEIHRSNMTKFIDGYRREDGKWIKGKSYSAADIKSVLETVRFNLNSQPQLSDN